MDRKQPPRLVLKRIQLNRKKDIRRCQTTKGGTYKVAEALYPQVVCAHQSDLKSFKHGVLAIHVRRSAGNSLHKSKP